MKEEPFDLDEIDETVENNRLSEKLDQFSESLITYARAIDSLKRFLMSNYEIAKDLRDYQRQTVEMAQQDIKDHGANAATMIIEATEKATDKAVARILAETDAACKRISEAENRYSIPPFAFNVILSALIWLTSFLCVIIYANTVRFHLDEITTLLSIFIGSFALTVLLLYLFHRYAK